MIIERNISSVIIGVDINEARDLYFDELIASEFINFKKDSIIKVLKQKSNGQIPLSVTWEITSNCNFKCPFCYINNSSSNNTKEIHRIDYEMIDYLIDKGMLFCTLTGGECLSHPEFNDLFLYLKNKGVLVSIFTNGSLLTQHHIDLFSEFKPYKIEVSIYGISEDTFKNCTGVDAIVMRNIFKNILLLKEKGIKIICKTPKTKININDYDLIENWCKSNLIPFYGSPELISKYNGESTVDYCINDSEIKEYYYSKFKRKMINSIFKFNSKTLFSCEGGSTSLFISYDQKIYPCSSAVGIHELSIDLKNKSINKALSEFNDLIKKFKGKELLGCSGCKNEELCNRCVISLFKLQPIEMDNIYDCNEFDNFICSIRKE